MRTDTLPQFEVILITHQKMYTVCASKRDKAKLSRHIYLHAMMNTAKNSMCVNGYRVLRTAGVSIALLMLLPAAGQCAYYDTTLMLSIPHRATLGETITISGSVYWVGCPFGGTCTDPANGGTVEFYDYYGTWITLGSQPLASGHATIALSSLGVGLHRFAADYSGTTMGSGRQELFHD